MGYSARNTCGDCPTPAIQTVHPKFQKDVQNDANNINLLGIGSESDYADYAFNSALNTKFCGRESTYWPSRRFANVTGDKGERALTPQVGYNCRFSHYNDTDCEDCGCLTLRNPCVLKSGAWDKCGCNYLWYNRSPSSWKSPMDGNINANVRWG